MSTAGGKIDKDKLYGDFREFEKKKQKLWMKSVHKALDVAEDDVQFNQSVKNGMGWKELAVIAAMVMSGVGLTGAIVSQMSQQPQAPPVVTAPVSPGDLADTEYEVRFYDKDGNPIDVPHISTRGK